MNLVSDRQFGELPEDTEGLTKLLRDLLGELEDMERRTVVGGATRRLIEHGRSLDSLLWKAHREWREHSRGSEAEGLDDLRQTLIAAQQEAEQLRVALLISSAPLDAARRGRPAWPDAPSSPVFEPEPGTELTEVHRRIRDLLDRLEGQLSASTEDAGPHGRNPTPEFPRDEPDPSLRAGSSAVDGLLWRITSNWQHLQRSPTPDRIALLCDELERASHEVRQLAANIETATRMAETGATAPAPLGPSHPPFRDPVTGSLSREGFDVLVMGELKRSRRYRRPFTLLLVEARESDVRGLADLTEQLTDGLRGSDFVGRYVDRLIAIGLPETSPEAALVAARRVMRSLPAGTSEAGPRFGLASLPEDGRTLAELVALARRQLREGPVSSSETGTDYWGV